MALISLTKPVIPRESAASFGTVLSFTATSASGARDSVPVPVTGLLLLVQNSDGATAYDVTLYGTEDPYGRQHTITQELAANQIRAFKIPGPTGWETAAGSGVMEILGENAAITVVALPLGAASL